MSPRVLVFDVNETLIDIDALEPHFERIFGDSSVLREWFGQLVMYSMTVTLAGRYADFFALGQGVVHMLAEIHQVDVNDGDLHALAEGMRTMPAHRDAAEGLSLLRDNGYRLVTLTNSPHSDGPTPLDHAGLTEFFERQFTVDDSRVFKPSTSLYTGVAHSLGVAPGDCMMVAAHAWDTIGAQSAGFSGALITRPGNAALRVPGIPEPTVIASNLLQLNEVLVL
ncbi:haloacid dehalogenase type II [Mycolicibacterium brisbanense]